jgi:hypothetical protein
MSNSFKKPRNALFPLAIVVFLVSTLILSGCGDNTPTAPASPTPTPGGSNPQPARPTAQVTPSGPVPVVSKTSLNFSAYQEPKVNVTPAFPAYTVASDLANITNLANFKLSAAEQKLLAQNYFVVEPGSAKYFFEAYQSIPNAQIPIYISTDSVANVYHMLFDKLLRETEKQYLQPDLLILNQALYEASLKQYDQFKGTPWEGAAARNVAFTAVARKLADPKTDFGAIPTYAAPLVEAELKLVNEAKGSAPSPLMGSDYKDDYSQYIPRGHYTKSEELKNYFKAMMWYGRVTFRVKSESETQSALLLTLALANGQAANHKASDLWQAIYEPTAFFVGQADDLTYLDYLNAAKAVWGETGLNDAKTLTDSGKLATFRAAIQRLAPGKINSLLNPSTSDPQEENKGLRTMGQRFTLDAYLMQNLVQPKVPGRTMPKGLDFPAALGSEQAVKILDKQGDTQNPAYPVQLNKLKGEVAAISPDQWTQNLYWGWLYKLQSLTAKPGAGYPAYMQNEAWQSKQLLTVLGSWTELKHDTILYSKQVAVATSARGPDQNAVTVGFVEPEPVYYARLAALASMTRTGLQQRNLLAKEQADVLTQLENTAMQLKTIAEKELNAQQLGTDEVNFIQGWASQLKNFTYAAADSAEKGIGNQLDNQDPALVADVATGETGILEEATGRVNSIYVAVPVNGKLILAKGAVYSQYEFLTKPAERLTDESWQKQLNAGQVPALEDWKKSFIAGS